MTTRWEGSGSRGWDSGRAGSRDRRLPQAPQPLQPRTALPPAWVCGGDAAKGRSGGREGTESLGMGPQEADAHDAQQGGRPGRKGGQGAGEKVGEGPGGVGRAGRGCEGRARARHPGPTGYGCTWEPSFAEKGKVASLLIRGGTRLCEARSSCSLGSPIEEKRGKIINTQLIARVNLYLV